MTVIDCDDFHPQIAGLRGIAEGATPTKVSLFTTLPPRLYDQILIASICGPRSLNLVGRMLFSDYSKPDANVDAQRLNLLEAILCDFQAAFPDLQFELRLDRRVVNAQAILFRGKRCVLIYGGLALHPSLAEASLTFVFLHEAGHHLATGPRLPFNVTLACDCISDVWATIHGADILFQQTGRRLQIKEALSELNSLMSESDEIGSTYSLTNPTACWNHCWLRRRETLASGLPRPPTTCALMINDDIGDTDGVTYSVTE